MSAHKGWPFAREHARANARVTGQPPATLAQLDQQITRPVDLPLRLFPPDNWLNFDQQNYVALAAIAARALIISFKVPIGYNGIINAIGNNFVGGGWVEGSSAVIWRVLVDGAPPPGATSYDTILGSLGSPANPTKIAGFRIYENQTVQLVADNISVIVAGQLVGGRLLGYLYPRELDSQDFV
jgi:hypothetical protein